MIISGEFEVGNKNYDRCLEPSDWRYSAVAVALVRYFKHFEIAFEIDGRKLYYNYEDIDLQIEAVDRRYLDFAEYWFRALMHHRLLEDLYASEELTEEQQKLVNTKLAANTIMKKVFKGYKADSLTKEVLDEILEKSREDLIRETYINSIRGYRKFVNLSSYKKDSLERCRLLGFYVDLGRKTKSLGFNFDKGSVNSDDYLEFDYIPFAFTKDRESIFINNNVSISDLVYTNDNVGLYFDRLVDKKASWNTIFYSQMRSSSFIDADVEIILKGVETDYYETIIVRQSALNIFSEIKKNDNGEGELSNLEKALKLSIKVNDNYYINIADELTNSVLNELVLDGLIETLFKLENVQNSSSKYSFVISELIRVNIVIYKESGRLEENMAEKNYLASAYHAANEIKSKLRARKAENKIKGYRQRLTSSIVAHDYDRFIEVMLQLSAYTETSFSFLHLLIQDFEGNKNIAYAFINALDNYDKNNNGESTEEGK